MIAAFPMYDRPANRAAHDRLWAGIRDRLRAGGVDAPDGLSRDIAFDAGWGRDDLLLGQICIAPLLRTHSDGATRIGRGDHRLEGCAAGHYFSHLVMRADDLRDPEEALAMGRIAINSDCSHSGWHSLLATFGDRLPDLEPALVTGGHDRSIDALNAGRADIAAIDAVTWKLAERDRAADLSGLRIAGRTAPAPGMTFISRTDLDPGLAFAAIAEAIDALDQADRDALCLHGLVPAD